VVCLSVLQLVFSDDMPEVVRPGEQVFVVVDGVAYEVVNDDGSDIGSANGRPISDGVADVHLPESKCDETVSSNRGTISSSNNIVSQSVTNSGGSLHNRGTISSSDNCVSVTKSDRSLDKNGHVGFTVSPKQPDLRPDDAQHKLLSSDSRVSSTSSVVLSDSAGISSVNIPQSSEVNNEPTMPQPRTVLADTDDEFKHLTDEFANSLAPSDSQPSSTEPATSMKPSVGVVRCLPLLRTQLPKITFQARPLMRLQLPTTTNSMPTVGPLTVITSTRPTPVISSPGQHTVTTVIRSNSSVKVASQQPSVVPAVSPNKNKSPAKKNTSVEKDITSAVSFKRNKDIASAAPFIKRSRQPRISKSIVNRCIILFA